MWNRERVGNICSAQLDQGEREGPVRHRFLYADVECYGHVQQAEGRRAPRRTGPAR
jgi:hypothetical protein